MQKSSSSFEKQLDSLKNTNVIPPKQITQKRLVQSLKSLDHKAKSPLRQSNQRKVIKQLPNTVKNPNPPKREQILEQKNIEAHQAILMQNYEQAIQLYTELIPISNKDSKIYSNRAIAYKKLGQFEQCLADAYQAISLDHNNPRAFWLLGSVTILQLQDIDPIDVNDNTLKQANLGIKYLEKASQILQTVWEARLEKLKSQVDSNIASGEIIFSLLTKQLHINNALNLQQTLTQIILRSKKMDLLDEMNESIEQFTNQSNILDVAYYYCPESMKIMEEPMIAESGISYDSLYVKEYTSQKQIAIPNRQLKLAIKQYNLDDISYKDIKLE